MTAQFDDTFRHRGTDYSLAGVSEDSLFDPALLGLEPVASCTACYRGYVATFAVLDGRLVLDALDVSLYRRVPGPQRWPYEDVVGPAINGVSPARPRGGGFFNNRYAGLAYHLEYTGGLLIADGFIRELYVHMGFHPAWKYQTVIELVFENGRLRTETDKSAEVAAVRSRATSDPPRGDLAGWVERCFDQSYGPT